MQVRVRKAFTLVEILIVVVILGILAAIVVPQFTNATQDAQGGNLLTQMDTLQNQIELYAARNNGQDPDLLGTGWVDLINNGYIKTAPRNPACPGTNAQREAIAATPTANVGWVWDAATRTISASYFDEVNGVVTTTP